MAITSAGYVGTVDAAQWAKLAPSAGAAEYGVVGAGDFKVTAGAGTGVLSVATGVGWGKGVIDTNDAAISLTATIPATGTRWDTVVLNRKWLVSGSATTAKLLTGTATKQIAPRLSNAGVEDEQPIALVLWTAGQTSPTQIVDLRVWAGNGGVYASDSLVLGFLDRVGSAVTIQGDRWQRTVDASGVVQWTKLGMLGRIPLGDGTFAIIQAGTTSASPDAAGNIGITYPVPFPSGVISMMVCSGDHAANGSGISIQVSGSFTRNNSILYVNVSTTAGPKVGGSYRIDWQVIGK